MGNEMTPAERLKEAIASKQLTHEGFAQLLGEKLQRVKDVLRGKQRIPQPMIEAMYREGFDVSYILTGHPVGQRVDALEQRMAWVKETTEKALALADDRSKQTLIQSVLFGALVNDRKLVDAAIEHYVIQRDAEVALSESLPKQARKSRKKD